MSIPKRIHYCWFGGNPLPEDAKRYIDSWKKYCPDYEIIQWDETNFDLESNAYVREAFQSRKWAFITDYVRLFVLYTYGGIYMDTDVEVLKNLDVFLNQHAFSGFERTEMIPTGIMASEQGGLWVGMLLHYYDDHHFLLKDGTMDMTTNVVTITNMTKERYPIVLDGTLQKCNGDVTFYPPEYFCPKSYQTGKIELTKNSYTIHHFAGSWLTEEEKKNAARTRKYRKVFGKRIGGSLAYYHGRIQSQGLLTSFQKGIRHLRGKETENE